METVLKYFLDLQEYYLPADPRNAEIFIVKNYHATFFLMVFYICFAKSLGIKLMKNREPFECRYAMIVYNILQIIWNGWMFLKACQAFCESNLRLFCSEVGKPGDPGADLISFLCLQYAYNKIFDLVDTVFMVLRKKNKQISHLHVYHHAMMIFCGWMSNKFAPGGLGLYVGILNTFVHVVMYGYYLLTAISPQYKESIWWKRHITELQMIQFGLIGLISVIHFLNPTCSYPRVGIMILIPQNSYILYMFWKYYKTTYLKPTKEKNT